jgi:Ca2+-binding EF-hand superfamily protein
MLNVKIVIDVAVTSAPARARWHHLLCATHKTTPIEVLSTTERLMYTLPRLVWAAILTALAAVTVLNTASADETAALATGGYATGLRTMEMMHMIDSNKDGMISKDEWLAYQNRLFTALDKNKDGFLDVQEFYGDPKPVDFATGGYAHGLETKQMFGKIDANGDGKVSHEEYINFQMKVFEMMDTNKKQELGVADFIGKTH